MTTRTSTSATNPTFANMKKPTFANKPTVHARQYLPGRRPKRSPQRSNEKQALVKDAAQQYHAYELVMAAIDIILLCFLFTLIGALILSLVVNLIIAAGGCSYQTDMYVMEG